jgi:hypothetical protein
LLCQSVLGYGFLTEAWGKVKGETAAAVFLFPPRVLQIRAGVFSDAKRMSNRATPNPQQESTMEEILASIRKVISEDPPPQEAAKVVRKTSVPKAQVIPDRPKPRVVVTVPAAAPVKKQGLPKLRRTEVQQSGYGQKGVRLGGRPSLPEGCNRERISEGHHKNSGQNRSK